MRILLPIYFILLFGGLACKNENVSEFQEKGATIVLDSLSQEKTKLDLLKLSPESKKDLESYEDFKNLQNLIKTMHTSNPYYIKKYADSVDVLIQVFEENLTKDHLKVNSITSRVAVLSTASGLLIQVSNKKSLSSDKLLDANKRLLTAYNSLIIQLNELSLAIPDAIEEELLRDNTISKDSIAEEEKQNLIIEE